VRSSASALLPDQCRAICLATAKQRAHNASLARESPSRAAPTTSASVIAAGCRAWGARARAGFTQQRNTMICRQSTGCILILRRSVALANSRTTARTKQRGAKPHNAAARDCYRVRRGQRRSAPQSEQRGINAKAGRPRDFGVEAARANGAPRRALSSTPMRFRPILKRRTVTRLQLGQAQPPISPTRLPVQSPPGRRWRVRAGSPA
jgi:hypothetical protein